LHVGRATVIGSKRNSKKHGSGDVRRPSLFKSIQTLLGGTKNFEAGTIKLPNDSVMENLDNNSFISSKLNTFLSRNDGQVNDLDSFKNFIDLQKTFSLNGSIMEKSNLVSPNSLKNYEHQSDTRIGKRFKYNPKTTIEENEELEATDNEYQKAKNKRKIHTNTLKPVNMNNFARPPTLTGSINTSICYSLQFTNIMDRNHNKERGLANISEFENKDNYNIRQEIEKEYQIMQLIKENIELRNKIIHSSPKKSDKINIHEPKMEKINLHDSPKKTDKTNISSHNNFITNNH